MEKITIIKNGPYFVCGEIPLEEMIIEQGAEGNVYRSSKIYPLKSNYMLCRCGKTKTPPYCDGSHSLLGFDGKLTASKEPFNSQAIKIEGKDIILKDVDSLCAYARFCHTKDSDVWSATRRNEKSAAIKMACECPSGRLVIEDKRTKEDIEPVFEKSIVILQDPSKDCSGPLWVRGKIPIEDEENKRYEVRNRVTLCRCGESLNKPFCDASHISEKFKDK